MKNYLKKAISAVIALALAASAVPATLAANITLTDVPETADYATAVKTLVALDIVNGYEDNTFLPDNLITRAEASKIVVAALNETASAEAMKGATKFSDIEAKHEWATGYINKGVSMGYINGMENNEFQPDGNVTYAQVIKMMLCAMGYEDYAASLADQYGYTGANWYIPYTQLAADAGVTDGVYAGPNEAVTRGQVAQLVYNAIKAPIVKNVGISYTDSGKIVPKIQIQDGEETSVYYKSILTEKFDAYFVEGYVTETQKDGTGLKADEVKFGIAKSKKYLEEDVRFTTTINDYTTVAATAGRILQKVYVGDTNAADYKATYATAIIMLDEYDDWTFIDFAPSGKNKTYTFDVKDLDDDEYYVGNTLTQTQWTARNTYLKFFADGATNSTKYLLDTTVDVYVNGVKVATTDPIWTYVINADVGEIELVDTYKTNGKIDAINVNSYVSGLVDGVSSSGKITLKDAPAGISSLTLDEDDTTVEFNIYYNGEAIELSDLKKDDVITVAYDVTAGANEKSALANSKFYEIYVSREVVTDTLRGRDDKESTVRIGDTYYDFDATSKYAPFNTVTGTAKLGDEYTLYVDAFGRIVKAEINSSAANWGIADKFTLSSSDDDYKLTIFQADGTTKAYYFDAAKAEVTLADGTVITKATNASGATTGTLLGETGLNTQVQSAVYSAVTPAFVKQDIEDRVIQYKVSTSSGKITELKFVANAINTLGGTDGKEEFKARNNQIGSIKMGEATKIVDATKYSADKDLFAATVDSLTDETNYKAYAYGTKVNNVYPFVLITEGESAYNATTRFAVVTEAGYQEEEDAETGDKIYKVKAMKGEETEIIFSDDIATSTLGQLYAGDVIYVKTNAKGYATAYDKIFSMGASIPAQATLAANSLVNTNKTYGNLTGITIPTSFTSLTNFSNDFTVAWTGVSNDAIQLIYGPVIEKADGYVTFAAIDAVGKTDTSKAAEAVEFDLASDVNVYTYDYSMGKDYRFDYSSAASAIVATNILDANMESDGNTIDWNKTVDGAKVNQEAVNFAFAVVVEDEIVDIFEIIAK